MVLLLYKKHLNLKAKENKMKRQTMKAIAIILVIALLLQVIPLEVLAQEPVGNEEIINTENELILFENEELRDYCEKYFVRKDGATVSAIYDSPVHYKTESGKLEQIDNTLIDIESNEKEYYQNENNDVKYSLPKIINNNSFSKKENV